MSSWICVESCGGMWLDNVLCVEDGEDCGVKLERCWGEDMCGSCWVNCDGVHYIVWICWFDGDLKKIAGVTPVGNIFGMKDLILEIAEFFFGLKFFGK